MTAASREYPTPAAQVALTLRRVAARQRRRGALAIALSGAAAIGAWLLTAAVLDRWIALPTAGRWAVFGIAAAALVRTVVKAAVAWRQADDPLAAARRVEAFDRAWCERLTTVVTQSVLPAAQRGSAALNAALAVGVHQRLAECPPVVRWPRRSACAAGAVAVLWGILAALPGVNLARPAARQLRPWALLPPVTATRLELVTPATSVRQGKPLAIVATVDGRVAAPTAWFGPDAAHEQAVPMKPSGAGRFAGLLPAAQRDFVYRVTAGDAAAGPVHVHVLRPPGIVTLSLRLDYPPSAGRPPLTLSQPEPRLVVPAGTRVSVTLTATEPLKRLRLRVGAATEAGQFEQAAAAWHASFVVTQSAAWSIELTAQNGLHGVGPAGMRVELMPPPSSKPTAVGSAIP